MASAKAETFLNQLKTNWVQILLALIAAGFTADYFGIVKHNKELSSSDKTLLIEELRNDRNYYQSLYKECQESVVQVQKDLSDIKQNTTLLTAVKYDIPVPMWLKDSKGKMVFINNEYERLFLFPVGKTMEDYIGKTDYDIWDKETAEQYRKNDIRAMQSQNPIYTTELIPMAGTLPKELRVVKYPQKKDGRTIGIGGIGIWIN